MITSILVVSINDAAERGNDGQGEKGLWEPRCLSCEYFTLFYVCRLHWLVFPHFTGVFALEHLVGRVLYLLKTNKKAKEREEKNLMKILKGIRSRDAKKFKGENKKKKLISVESNLVLLNVFIK
jgi:hypothetical protein